MSRKSHVHQIKDQSWANQVSTAKDHQRESAPVMWNHRSKKRRRWDRRTQVQDQMRQHKRDALEQVLK